MNARPITILALVQVAVVIISFFTLGMVLKAEGYPDPGIHFGGLALFLRHYDLFFILAPLGYAILAALAEYRWRDRDLYLPIVATGIGTILAILGVFYFAADPGCWVSIHG